MIDSCTFCHSTGPIAVCGDSYHRHVLAVVCRSGSQLNMSPIIVIKTWLIVFISAFFKIHFYVSEFNQISYDVQIYIFQYQFGVEYFTWDIIILEKNISIS